MNELMNSIDDIWCSAGLITAFCLHRMKSIGCVTSSSISWTCQETSSTSNHLKWKQEKKFVRKSVNKLSLRKGEWQMSPPRPHYVNEGIALITDRRGELETNYLYTQPINKLRTRKGKKKCNRTLFKLVKSTWQSFSFSTFLLSIRNSSQIPSAGFRSWHEREAKAVTEGESSLSMLWEQIVKYWNLIRCRSGNYHS